jgi:two-component system response regulator MprA
VLFAIVRFTELVIPELTMHVMIVDDNPDARELLSEQLRVLGIESSTCHDGYEAVERYPNEHPDAVMMDIAMPRLDGLEATLRIRRMDPGACIFVVTAYSEEMLRRASVAAGASGYYLKDNLDPLFAQLVRRLGVAVGR